MVYFDIGRNYQAKYWLNQYKTWMKFLILQLIALWNQTRMMMKKRRTSNESIKILKVGISPVLLSTCLAVLLNNKNYFQKVIALYRNVREGEMRGVFDIPQDKINDFVRNAKQTCHRYIANLKIP